MKIISIFLFVLLFSGIKVAAQQDTIIGNPPGYTTLQIRGVNGMVLDQSGNVWIAYSKIGLAKFDGAAWTVYDSLNSPLLKNKILSLTYNFSGLWAGTDTGLFNFNGVTWSWMNTSNSTIPTDTIPKLYSTGGNDLYLFSSNGFAYYDGITWQQYNTSNSNLANDTVQCLFKDASGILWIGTKNGLSEFDGTSWQNFTTANSALSDNNILSLIEDGNHYLFVGTFEYGLFIFSGNKFLPVNSFVSSFYDWPRNIGALFKLKNGNILLSENKNFFIETNPVKIIVRDGYLASDTNYIAVIDSSDRIYRIYKRNNFGGVTRSDSLGDYSPVQAPSSYNDLDINEVRCGMFNENTFHWDLTGTARYEVPKGSYKNSVFASALWIGGLDSSNNLHMAAQTYRQSGNDFWPGPLDTINTSIDSLTESRYDSLWKINKRTIDEFITQYDLGNVTNGTYAVPSEILYWPAHGSGNYSRNMAPFVDVNADGIYNPFDGDYPDVKGDQMLWWVMNDNFGLHKETGGIPLGIEIHSSAYAYACANIPSGSEAVNYTTFYSFDFINRSDTDYHDVYIGLYVDFDLGNYLDDYVGCNVAHDIGFGYNGDNNDEGIAGYGLNPPMMSVAVLKGPLAESGDSLDNNHNGIVDEPNEHCMMNHFVYYNNNNDPCLGNPTGTEDYYDYLRTISRCGTHFTYGGNGHGGGIGATNIPTDYFFPGMPYDTGWTDASAGNQPDDRRFLISSGPFSLRKGETRTVDYAYIFTRDESAPNGLTTSIAKNLSDVEKIKHWFDTDSFPCNNSGTGIHELEKNNSGFVIYPNPSRDEFTIRSNFPGGYGKAIKSVEIYNTLGKLADSRQYPFSKKEIKINVSNLRSGIYFVKISDEKSVAVKKLIIE
jgi:hypothetical protein